VIRAVDLFCGAGGASTGFVRACEALGLAYDLTAINHWDTAIDTHSTNHPNVKHLCMSVDKVNPLDIVPGGRLHLLLAGPECTHFSTARGGRPINEQSRATAWHILKWAQELYIDTIIIENVPEFRKWGPLGANGRPLKSREGQVFDAYLAAFRAMDYRPEVRILNAADYGDATTRKRLFIIMRRGRKSVRWPMPTHSATGKSTLFGPTRKWRAAREIIDWTIEGRSIFHRRKPLKPATVARILAGLEKFGGPELRPFLVVLRNHADGRSVNRPVPTIAAQGQHIGLAEPFLMHTSHGGRVHSLKKPVPTVTGAKRGELAVVEPFILGQQSGSVPRSTGHPLPTIATDGAISVVEPFLVPMYGERPTQEPRTHSVEKPVPTIPATGTGKFGVVQPFVVDANFGKGDHSHRARSVDAPLGTLPGSNRYAVAEPFLTKYFGTAKGAQSVERPLDTVTSKARFALVQPVVDGFVLDIRFRMLKPHELAAATSFPKSYVFKGNLEEVVKQIGNAWPGEVALALCREQLRDYVRGSGRKDRRVSA
jgi:DNA (cytosine-5)-methyltransferase 1